MDWVENLQIAKIENELLAELRAIQSVDESAAAAIDTAIAQAENEVREAESQAQAIQQRFAILLDDKRLLTATPQFDLQQRADLIGNNLREYLRANSRVLARLDIDVKLNALEIKHENNQLLPELDLILRAAKTYDNVGTRTSSYDDDTTDYEAMLEFSYPLGGSISTRAELKKRALSTRRLEIAYAERLERIQADLQRLASLLDFDEARQIAAVAAADESARLIRAEYDDDFGRSPRDLIQAYAQARAAKLEHAERVMDYHRNRFDYDNLTDRIIDAK